MNRATLVIYFQLGERKRLTGDNLRQYIHEPIYLLRKSIRSISLFTWDRTLSQRWLRQYSSLKKPVDHIRSSVDLLDMIDASDANEIFAG